MKIGLFYRCKITLLTVFLLSLLYTYILAFPQAEIYVSEWDVGEIRDIAVKEKLLKVKNLEEDILKVEKIHTTCDCLSVKVIKGIAKKGEYVVLKVIFNPSNFSESGLFAYVYVRLNDPALSTYRIVVKGTVLAHPIGKSHQIDTIYYKGNPIEETTQKDGRSKIVVFYSSTCGRCNKIKGGLEKIFREREFLRNNYVLDFYDYNYENNYLDLIRYEEIFKIYSRYKMIAFIGDKYYIDTQIIKELPVYLEQVNNLQIRRIDKVDVEKIIEQRIRSLSLPLVLSMGFLDGINPCAFVTIIFLVSLLSISHKDKIYIIKVGLLYSLGIFTVYLLLGAGILKGIRWVDAIRGLAIPISYAGIILLFLLGIINLLDAINYFLRKDTSSIILKLPKIIHRLIHRMLHVSVGSNYFVFSVFLAGALVALLESVCTGQTYIPCLLFINKLQDQLRVKTFLMLLVYNLMFIVPLLIVITLTVFGITVDRLTV